MNEKVINLLNLKPIVTLCRIRDVKTNIYIQMEPIDEQQELRIDKSKNYYGSIRYEKDGIIIPAENIYLYGEVDLTNQDDREIIEHFDLIDKDGATIYSNFDYENGTFKTIDGIAKRYTTFNPILWFSYCHVLIGKPKRVIVYKKIVKKYG